MDLLTVIFIGRSGCGKGTQVSKLATRQRIGDDRQSFKLSAGDNFRAFVKESSYASKLAEEINDNGNLQPEFLSIWAWGEELARKFKQDQHLLIDGAPRRESEAKIMESVFEFFDRKNVHVVYLNVSREWAIERLQDRGRKDDLQKGDVMNRMTWFNDEVIPVIDYYRGHRSHTFHEINGEQSIDDVHSDIVKSLGV